MTDVIDTVPDRDGLCSNVSETNYRAHHRRGEKPCAACRKAESRRLRDKRAKFAQVGLPDNDWRHGTMAGYCRSCRCERCMEAMRTYYRDLRARRRPQRVTA